MVTGDSRTTAEAVARQLGIDRVEAEVVPERKHEIVKRLKVEGRVVAMAGDGINDAPALAEAHVGIAMGTGTDVAIESAGVTLVKGDLRGVAKARRLRQSTMRGGSALPCLRAAALPHHRERSDDLQLGLGHRERAAASAGNAMTPN